MKPKHPSPTPILDAWLATPPGDALFERAIDAIVDRLLS
jgi:hypothetical protein